MSNFFSRLVGWLFLAYVGVKIVVAYYFFMFASSSVVAVLAKLPALSPWDAVILLLAVAVLSWATWVAELTTWAKSTIAPVAASAKLEKVAHVGRDDSRQSIDALRTDLRNFAVRCRAELVGRADVDFAALYEDIDQLERVCWAQNLSGNSHRSMRKSSIVQALLTALPRRTGMR